MHTERKDEISYDIYEIKSVLTLDLTLVLVEIVSKVISASTDILNGQNSHSGYGKNN